MANEIAVGKIIVWKGAGPLFHVLSALISVFEPTWRARKWKPWHMSFVCACDPALGWMVSEATWPRVRNMPLNSLIQIYGGDFQVIDWFRKPLEQPPVDDFVRDRLGSKYDVMVYPLTIAQYFVYRWFKISLPRLLDGSYDCWEYVEEFCECMGKPWKGTHNKLHRYPFLPDFLNEAESQSPDYTPRMDVGSWVTLALAIGSICSNIKSMLPYLKQIWNTAKNIWISFRKKKPTPAV